MGFFQEFREFAVKGNAVDMAVGIIIGAAFTKVVNSIVNDILMPPIGLLIGGVDFKHLQWVLRAAREAEDGTAMPAVAIRYGALVSTALEFLIVALAMFVVVKLMNRILRTREASAA